MEELVLKSENGDAITTSLLVAKKFGKNHAHVLRDIEILGCSDEFRESNFGLSSYFSQQNKELPMHIMTKDGFTFLVMGYTGGKAAKFKEDYILAFNQMEKKIKQIQQFEIPQTLSSALMLASKQAEMIELQESQIKELKPKAEYTDKVLDAKGLLNISVIAKTYGMSGAELNTILKLHKIIYKSGGVYVLYQQYQNMGLAQTSTYHYSNNGASLNLRWTQKGRKFIHDFLTKLDIKTNKEKYDDFLKEIVN